MSMAKTRCLLLASVGAGLLGCVSSGQGNRVLDTYETADVQDGGWLGYPRPEAAGWSSDQLDAAFAQAGQLGSTAVLVVDRGMVVDFVGDVSAPMKSYSVRKSLVSLILEPAVRNGTLGLDKPLAAFRFENADLLTEREKRATVAELLSSTSGIYLPAAKEPPALTERPARGSDEPGSRWWYNNWGFNLILPLFEAASGERLAPAFLQRIADPLQMEDLRASDIFYEYDPSRSAIPAYEFMISSRDLARVGVMLAGEGRWHGRQVIPADWVATITSPHWQFGDGSGYGYMWWVNPGRSQAFGASGEPSLLDRYDHFAAIGSYGQALLVIPQLDIVLVHRGDASVKGGVSDPDVFKLFAEILAARHGPGFAASQPVPVAFPNQEAVVRRGDPAELQLISPEEMALLEGSYATSAGVVMRAYRWRDMLFLSGPRPADAHVELAKRQDGGFTSRSAPIEVQFQRDDNGRASGFVLRFNGRTMEARRVADTQNASPR